MKFMMTMIETMDDFAKRDDPTQAPAYWAAWMAYSKAIEESGVLQNAAGLQPPSTGATVRLADGKRHVQDGPFADSKEQLGGYFVVDVADLDAALELAAKAPCASSGAVEVRPLLPPQDPSA